MIEFTNGNVAVLNQGQLGKLTLDGKTLHNQSITENFDLINPLHKFKSVCYTDTMMLGFDGHTVF